MPKLAAFFCSVVIVGLAGCSNTLRTYTDTLSLAFNPGDGASLTKEQLAKRTADALYATVGNLPRAQLSLAYTEQGQQKWISADKAFLVLDNGRLVKTTGFDNDLLFISGSEQDPLKQAMTKIQPGQQWQALSDWEARQESGYKLSYEVIEIAVDSIELLDHQFETKLVTEQVIFANGDTAINLFWFDLTSGSLLKSQQQIAPFWPQIELIHISNAARLLGIAKPRSSK